MRMGKVCFGSNYYVDLDNKEMVEHAKEAVYEDLINAIKYNECFDTLVVEETPEATEGDIAEFLLEE